MKPVVFVAVAVSALLAVGEAFTPAKVSYEEIGSASEEVSEIFGGALGEVGILSVTGIPGFAKLREEVLIAAADCAVHTRSSNAKSFKYVFPDGTARYTLGSKTLGNEAQAFTGADLTHTACSKFTNLERNFRDTMKDVMEKFVDRVDELQKHDESTRLLLDMETGDHLKSIKEIMDKGTQLEHFHTYEKYSARVLKQENEFTMDMHVDQGLFIALVPALVLSGENSGHGFFIQLPDNEIIEPNFSNGDEIVFVIGDGFAQWVNHHLSRPFRAVPHAVKLPEGFSIRSWYGRMVLPPDSAGIAEGDTFGNLREDLKYNSRRLSSANSACSSGLVLSERMLQSTCGADEIVCWVGCESLPECETGEAVACANTAGESITLCTGGGCSASCVPEELLGHGDHNETDEDNGDGDHNGTNGDGEHNHTHGDHSDSSKICNGFSLAMSAVGFIGYGDTSDVCVTYLIPGIDLDTSEKYIIASLFSVLVGIITEFTVSLRRKAQKQVGRGYVKDAGKMLLYALQIALLYTAMLIAMTYSVVLFFSVIVGLTIGHVLFNLNPEFKTKQKSSISGATEIKEKQAQKGEVLLDQDVEAVEEAVTVS